MPITVINLKKPSAKDSLARIFRSPTLEDFDRSAKLRRVEASSAKGKMGKDQTYSSKIP
jgi:hypothetical protein